MTTHDMLAMIENWTWTRIHPCRVRVSGAGSSRPTG